MKNFQKIILSIAFTVMMGLPVAFTAAPSVYAKSGNIPDNASLICKIFPFIYRIDAFAISDVCTSSKGTQTVTNRTSSFITFLLNLIFIGLIILSVFIIIRSAVKYIQSEGNDSKIQEAQKAIKAVFAGIAILIVGIVGLFIVVAFFQANDALNNNGTPEEINNLRG